MTAHLITVFADLPILISMTLIGQGEWEGLRVEGLGLKLTIRLSVLVSNRFCSTYAYIYVPCPFMVKVSDSILKSYKQTNK